LPENEDSLVPTKDLETIFWEAVNEVDPSNLISRTVSRKGSLLTIEVEGATVTEDLSHYSRIIVLGIGKASAKMAACMEGILGSELSRGFVITKYGHGLDLQKIRVHEAGHPVPDQNSMDGAVKLVHIAADADEETFMINLISGGGSSLFCLPLDGISLEDKQRTTGVLLASGATIDEINCIRKHISKVKGGKFAKIAYPARLINLILSDVVGDRIDTIASGIAAPDPTTFHEALSIIKKYSIEDKIPRPVRDALISGAQGLIPETPKDNDPAFKNTTNIIVGSNRLACKAALRCAQRLGYDARILSTEIIGEARQAGECLSLIARDMDSGISGLTKPALLIAGGETTVTIQGKGKGGRNQEMALAFACNLYKISPGARNVFFLSAGTDGIDGPTDAAGAFVTPELMQKMTGIESDALDHLSRNDTYHFFESYGLLFKTGPTYTNVCDIQLLMVV
jgi:glycerate 2-kinase